MVSKMCNSQGTLARNWPANWAMAAPYCASTAALKRIQPSMSSGWGGLCKAFSGMPSAFTGRRSAA
ncbi:hypothetical protein [Paraburkholderia phenazinium]|uniref:hypothetical protein n=1 Tax=Paraburkholderia phenazinium TaxID=60549 RepID=UPI0009415477|nr:hypothetical protein [Paraburkholderia phenazinium]